MRGRAAPLRSLPPRLASLHRAAGPARQRPPRPEGFGCDTRGAAPPRPAWLPPRGKGLRVAPPRKGTAPPPPPLPSSPALPAGPAPRWRPPPGPARPDPTRSMEPVPAPSRGAMAGPELGSRLSGAVGDRCRLGGLRHEAAPPRREKQAGEAAPCAFRLGRAGLCTNKIKSVRKERLSWLFMRYPSPSSGHSPGGGSRAGRWVPGR